MFVHINVSCSLVQQRRNVKLFPVWEVGRTRDKRRKQRREAEWFPAYRGFTSGYVNTETILHFFYKITNERGTKTVFIRSCKMVLWPIRARVLFELFYKTELAPGISWNR